MNSSYITMYTHGFIYGFFKNIDNNYLKKLSIKNYKNRMNKNKNTTRSEDIIIPLNKEIKNIATKMSKVYYKHFNKKLKIANSGKDNDYWAQVHLERESTQYHNHYDVNVDVVGVYYVSIPKNSGDLILKYKKHELDISKWYFPPETNKFIIFDSGLDHAVAPNTSKQPRVCISINFKKYE